MVDSADPGFYGAAWRFADFCQQLYAGSIYLQFVLKSRELSGLFRSSPRFATRLLWDARSSLTERRLQEIDVHE